MGLFNKLKYFITIKGLNAMEFTFKCKTIRIVFDKKQKLFLK